MANILSKLVYLEVENGVVEGFIVGSNGVQLSHLLFSGGTLFFCYDKEAPLRILMAFYPFFESNSGIMINC